MNYYSELRILKCVLLQVFCVNYSIAQRMRINTMFGFFSPFPTEYNSHSQVQLELQTQAMLPLLETSDGQGAIVQCQECTGIIAKQ